MQRAAPQRQLRAPRPWERRRHARDFVTAGAAGEPLYGREHELQVVAGLGGGLATGPGGALAIRGEAGIGKSALLAAAAGLAADSSAWVLSATGIQAEARLPFAALHQLLRPVPSYCWRDWPSRPRERCSMPAPPASIRRCGTGCSPRRQAIRWR